MFASLPKPYWLGLAWLLVGATPAMAQQEYEVMFPYSLGSDAVANVKKSSFISDSTTFFVDGKIHSVTINKTTYDRAFVNVSRFGANHMLGSAFSVRWFLDVEFSRRVEEGKETPRIVTNEDIVRGRPRLDFTYFGSNGLEYFAGATYWYVPAYEKTSTSVNVDSVSHYSEASMLVPHLGLVKRGSGFNGGFYYKHGTEVRQKVKVVNSQDSSALIFDNKVYDPTRIAIFLNASLGKSSKLGGEFAAIQASEGGNKTDDGDTISEDYTLARLDGTFGLSTNLRWRTVGMYKTISYKDNRNVILPAMAMWAVHNQILIGKDDNSSSYFGLAYGQGKDRQSLPEFNADYSLHLYAFSAGLNVAF